VIAVLGDSLDQMKLVTCPGCSRHVKPTDSSCPFCSALVPPQPAVAARPRVRRALMAAGAAAVAIACSSNDTTQADSGPNAIDAAYGGPPFDAGADTIATFYGGPPIDSSVPDAADASAPKDASDGGG
jgi:hypothetical protein